MVFFVGLTGLFFSGWLCKKKICSRRTTLRLQRPGRKLRRENLRICLELQGGIHKHTYN